MHSRVETPTQGELFFIAIPFIAATPILTPVNDPGPVFTAKRSMLSGEMLHIESRLDTIGTKVWL